MSRLLVLALAIACAQGCRAHWTAEVTQPMLVLQAGAAARTSMPLTIFTRDMQLRYARLKNTAYYVVVSRDRFRFYLSLQHKWEAMSDVRTWDAWVEDARGIRHYPEEVDQRRMVPLGWGTVQVYQGIGEITVYGRDLYAVAGHLTLVLRRPGYEYRYSWNSYEDPEAEATATRVPPPGRASQSATRDGR